MHTIFSIFSLQNLIIELRRVISRFPLSALCILIVTGILSYENAMSYSDISSELRDTLGYITIASGIAFFLATALDLFLEQVHRKWVYRVIGYIGTIAYAFYLYTSLESRMSSTESTTLILLSLFGFLITLFFAPYIRDLVQKKYSQEAYIHYFYSIAIAFLTAMIMSGILMILGSIALWSIDILFTVDWIGDKAYGYMAIFSFAFVAPLF